MFKQHRHKIFSVLTVVCLSLSSPLLLARNSWAQQSPEPEIAALTKQLESQDVNQRLEALESLSNVGEMYKGVKLKAVVASMVAAVDDPDARVRQQSASHLGNYLWGNDLNLMQSAQAAIPSLIAALKDPNKDVRHQAAIDLGLKGVPARLSIPALIGALRDRSEDVRFQAVTALGKSDTQAHGNTSADAALQDEAVNALIRVARKDSSGDVRIEAVNALENMDALPEDLQRKYNNYGCLGSLGKGVFWRGF